MKSYPPIHVNFARRTLKSVIAGMPLWMLGAIAVGLILIIFSGLRAASIADQRQSLEDALQRNLKRRDAISHIVVKPVIIPEARALAINAAVAQLNLPWSDVFDAIEAATPANIALVSIEPDAKKQVLKGEAEALNSDDMIAYIERLKKVDFFVQVDLVKHEVSAQDPYKPLRFEFEAQWRSPLSSKGKAL
jgi:Tfp pilus assembly protein PilN